MRNKRLDKVLSVKKRMRKAGKLGGWVGQNVTISKNINEDAVYQYGLKVGGKYLVLHIGAGLVQIQLPNGTCWLSLGVFEEFQKIAA